MIDVTPRTFAATLGALSALAMGVATRRGGTCTVVAVNEFIDERRYGRLLALFSASIIVLGGLVLAESFDVLPSLPATAPVTRATVWGGLLLGLGASVNGACALGTIARIGAGQWCYVATPIGYYAGCHLAARALVDKPSYPVYDSPTLHAPVSIVVLLLAIVTTLAASALHSHRSHARSGLAAPDSLPSNRRMRCSNEPPLAAHASLVSPARNSSSVASARA